MRSLKTREDIVAIVSENEPRQRPELIGRAFADSQRAPPTRLNAIFLLQKYAVHFDDDEKYCFLRFALEKSCPLDPINIMVLLKYFAFDPCMLVPPKTMTDDHFIVLKNLKGNIQEIAKSVTEIINGEPTTIFKALGESKFLSTSTLADHSMRFNARYAGRFVDLMCGFAEIPLPPSRARARLYPELVCLSTAVKEGRVTPRCVSRWVKLWLEVDPELEPILRAHISCQEQLQGRVDEIFRGNDAAAADSVPCWESRDCRHSMSFDVKRIGTDISIDDAIAAVNAAGGQITVSYRLRRDPRFVDKMAAIMFQVSIGQPKYFLDCLDLNGKDELIRALFSKPIKAHEFPTFQACAIATFTMLDVSNSTLRHKTPAKDVSKLKDLLWRKQTRPCRALCEIVILSAADYSAAFIYHLAWELDVIIHAK